MALTWNSSFLIGSFKSQFSLVTLIAFSRAIFAANCHKSALEIPELKNIISWICQNHNHMNDFLIMTTSCFQTSTSYRKVISRSNTWWPVFFGVNQFQTSCSQSQFVVGGSFSNRHWPGILFKQIIIFSIIYGLYWFCLSRSTGILSPFLKCLNNWRWKNQYNHF